MTAVELSPPPAPGHLAEPVPRPRGTSAHMPENSMLLWAGQQPQQLGHSLVWGV